MNNLNSLIAFLSPWLFGSMCLYASLSRMGNRKHYACAFYAGYGFFFGYLLLTLLLRFTDWLGFGLHYPIVLSGLLLCSLLLSLFLLPVSQILSGIQHWNFSRRNPRSYPPALIISIVLFSAIISHLVFAGFEIIWRPMYPWDAWTTWAVKAKILTHEGKLVDFIPAQEWLRDRLSQAYTLPAHDYPLFIPLVQTWIALSIGDWSDTLVNLPWLGCGIALLLIVYAQGKIIGLNHLMSLLMTYLLISLPMLNTHIALAGYADIWQAAYTSSALLAVINWRLQGDKIQLLLSLSMALAGLAIKLEGFIWLLLVLVYIVLTVFPMRQLLNVLILLSLFVFIIWATGGWLVTSSDFGAIGLENNSLYLGPLGEFPLHFTNVLQPVIKALFQSQSWHLFWYWITLTLLVCIVPPYQAEKKLFVILLGLVATAIFIIFFLSDAALWAQNQTSLNRLLLHFVPALLYAAFMTWVAQFKSREIDSEDLQVSTNP